MSHFLPLLATICALAGVPPGVVIVRRMRDRRAKVNFAIEQVPDLVATMASYVGHIEAHVEHMEQLVLDLREIVDRRRHDRH